MSDLRQHYLGSESDGRETRFWCRYCAADLAPADRNWDKFSGHADNCDAILAGIAENNYPPGRYHYPQSPQESLLQKKMSFYIFYGNRAKMDLNGLAVRHL